MTGSVGEVSLGGSPDVAVLEVGLDVLQNRIEELRKLGYEDPMKHKMFKR